MQLFVQGQWWSVVVRMWRKWYPKILTHSQYASTERSASQQFTDSSYLPVALFAMMGPWRLKLLTGTAKARGACQSFNLVAFA